MSETTDRLNELDNAAGELCEKVLRVRDYPGWLRKTYVLTLPFSWLTLMFTVFCIAMVGISCNIVTAAIKLWNGER